MAFEGIFHCLWGREVQVGGKLSKGHEVDCCMMTAKNYMLKKTRICFEREGEKGRKSLGFGLGKDQGELSTGIVTLSNSYGLCWRGGIMY